MLIAVSLLALACLILGKDIRSLKDVDWRAEINKVKDNLRPWALKAGRIAARPILQFYYVLEDGNTSTLDRALIYAAVIYTVLPVDFFPRAVYGFLGILDDGLAVGYVYRKVKDKITPEVNLKVEETLDNWFGVECEVV